MFPGGSSSCFWSRRGAVVKAAVFDPGLFWQWLVAKLGIASRLLEGVLVSSLSSGSTCSGNPVQSPSKPAADTSYWPAIASLTLGVFGLVMAEFLSISLLTAMATDLGISDGAAGQAITVTALVGAVGAPSLHC